MTPAEAYTKWLDTNDSQAFAIALRYQVQRIQQDQEIDNISVLIDAPTVIEDLQLAIAEQDRLRKGLDLMYGLYEDGVDCYEECYEAGYLGKLEEKK